MNSFFKKIICLFLCLRFLPAHGEDYHFMEHAQSLVNYEKSIMVPEQILARYHIGLYSYISYLNTLESILNKTITDTSNNYSSYLNSGKDVSKIISSGGTPNLNTLGKLIQDQMQTKFERYFLENNMNNISLVFDKINSSRDILNNYCQFS
jgi:hypothetical protein